MKLSTKLAIGSFIASLAVLLDNGLQWHSWFDITEVHHETWMIAFLFLGAGILIGGKLNERRNSEGRNR